MEKLKNLVPMVAFCLLFAKQLATGFALYDVLALLILSALFCINNLEVENKKLKQILDDVNKNNKANEDLHKRYEELKTHVTGLKLSQQMRPGNLR